jgi:hypothetical protein
MNTKTPLRILAFLTLTLLLTACPQERDPQEIALADLESRFSAILALAQSRSCENPADWSYTAYGSKACGGPQGYLAYPLTIDVQRFLSKVGAHRQAENQYNIDFDITSTCDFSVAPTRVDCADQLPVLGYD